MTDFPDLKIKALVNFPATAVGGTSIAVTKVNGNFVIDFDCSELAQIVTVSSLPTTFLVLWDQTQNSYCRISLTDFKTVLGL